jgi:protein SCO1/2
MSRGSLRLRVVAACGVFLFFALAGSAGSQPPTAVLDRIGIDQRLGAELPLELGFRDESGRAIRLGDLVKDKPVVLSLVYYECPMLCTEVLNGLLRSLRALSFDVGREFEVITVSFDPAETPELARAKKKEYLARYDRPGAASGWHFLTGEEESIRTLTRAVGFRYLYLPERDEFAHASGVMVLTPSGKVSRYFYGIDYATRDLRLGLVEASSHRIGSAVDQILLYCFHYDPTTGKYGVVILNVLRLAGLATVAALGSFIWVSHRRERRARLSKRAS